VDTNNCVHELVPAHLDSGFVGLVFALVQRWHLYHGDLLLYQESNRRRRRMWTLQQMEADDCQQQLSAHLTIRDQPSSQSHGQDISYETGHLLYKMCISFHKYAIFREFQHI